MLALFVREGKIIRREVKDFSHNLSKKKLKFQIFELLLKLKKNYLFVKMEFIAEIGLLSLVLTLQSCNWDGEIKRER